MQDTKDMPKQVRINSIASDKLDKIVAYEESKGLNLNRSNIVAIEIDNRYKRLPKEFK